MTQAAARVCGQLLHAGRLIELPSAILLALCCVLPAVHAAPTLPVQVSLGSGLIGLYYGFRIAFDAAAFKQYAREGNWAPFDEGLAGLGMHKAQAARPTADRIRGALRLLRWRIVWLFVQVASCALTGLPIWGATP